MSKGYASLASFSSLIFLYSLNFLLITDTSSSQKKNSPRCSPEFLLFQVSTLRGAYHYYTVQAVLLLLILCPKAYLHAKPLLEHMLRCILVHRRD